MGHGDTEIGDRCSMLRKDIACRQDIVSRIGVGFVLPELNLVEPESRPSVKVENAVAA